MGRWSTVLVTLGVVLLIAVVSFYAFIYSGAYNIAASVGHTPAVAWMLNTVMENSVESHAKEVQIPSGIDLADRTLIERGAKPYSDMCQMCHGGPGVRRAEWISMTPEPPELAEAASHWRGPELYWIIKNGIKMAGMPAFGPSHEEKELWSLTAFVNALPKMSPQQYEQLTGGGSPESAPDGHGHSH